MKHYNFKISKKKFTHHISLNLFLISIHTVNLFAIPIENPIPLSSINISKEDQELIEKSLVNLRVDDGGCSASRIGPNLFLTAAHCVDEITSDFKFLIKPQICIDDPATFTLTAQVLKPTISNTTMVANTSGKIIQKIVTNPKKPISKTSLKPALKPALKSLHCNDLLVSETIISPNFKYLFINYLKTEKKLSTHLDLTHSPNDQKWENKKNDLVLLRNYYSALYSLFDVAILKTLSDDHPENNLSTFIKNEDLSNISKNNLESCSEDCTESSKKNIDLLKQLFFAGRSNYVVSFNEKDLRFETQASEDKLEYHFGKSSEALNDRLNSFYSYLTADHSASIALNNILLALNYTKNLKAKNSAEFVSYLTQVKNHTTSLNSVHHYEKDSMIIEHNNEQSLALNGDSGGPVFTIEKDGTPRLVGTISTIKLGLDFSNKENQNNTDLQVPYSFDLYQTQNDGSIQILQKVELPKMPVGWTDTKKDSQEFKDIVLELKIYSLSHPDVDMNTIKVRRNIHRVSYNNFSDFNLEQHSSF